MADPVATPPAKGPSMPIQILKALVVTGLLFVAGGLTGAFLADIVLSSVSESLDAPPLWVVIIGGFVLSFLAVLLHELGHAAGGALSGFSFVMLTAGPLKVVREAGALRIRLNTSLNAFGGLALLLPDDTENLKSRMLRYVAGGPMASVLAGGLALALAFSPLAGTTETGRDGVFLTLMGFGFLSLAIGSISLVPLKNSGFATDGAQLLDLLRGGNRTERRLLMLALVAESMHGTRPRLLTEDTLQRLLAADVTPPDPLSVAARQYGYMIALDRGDTASARQYLDFVMAHRDAYPRALQGSLFLEAAFFTARYENDASAARAFLGQAKGGFEEKQTRARAEAATLLVENRIPEAIQRAGEGLALLPKAMDAGTALLEKDWLEEIAGTPIAPTPNPTV